MKTVGATTVIRQSDNKMSASGLNQLEQLALGWFYSPRNSSEVFRAGGLLEQLESYGKTYQARLEQQQMLTGDENTGSFKPLKWTAYAVIFGLGAYKALASIAHGYYNILFLIIFCIAGLLIARAISKFPRLTKLGSAYLDRLQLAFTNLKYEAQKPYIPTNEPQVAPQTTFAGVDPLLLSVGVFGSAILAGTVFDSYNQAFARHQAAVNSSSCSSGCGSSCSSSTGDSGGSSCSSGDGGGGGCGSGCGGGCGGGGCS
jgi:uncharacterized protein (TIGR04222 family)